MKKPLVLNQVGSLAFSKGEKMALALKGSVDRDLKRDLMVMLNFVRILTQTPSIRGESGVSIVTATGFFDAESLDEMQAAIEEGCEGIV